MSKIKNVLKRLYCIFVGSHKNTASEGQGTFNAICDRCHKKVIGISPQMSMSLRCELGFHCYCDLRQDGDLVHWYRVCCRCHKVTGAN